ncbi:tetratricopeptide repeat protein [Streptomyces sp. NPDC004244]
MLGDIHFAHGDMNQAASAFTTARTEAEQHGNTGEQAITQAHLALAYAFTDPDRADDEIALAEQLLAGLDQRATALTVQVVALARDAGPLADLDGARALRTEIREAGITSAEAVLELALALHHAVLGEHDKVRTVIDRLHDLAERGDYAYCADVAHYMAGLPMPRLLPHNLAGRPGHRSDPVAAARGGPADSHRGAPVILRTCTSFRRCRLQRRVCCSAVLRPRARRVAGRSAVRRMAHCPDRLPGWPALGKPSCPSRPAAAAACAARTSRSPHRPLALGRTDRTAMSSRRGSYVHGQRVGARQILEGPGPVPRE